MTASSPPSLLVHAGLASGETLSTYSSHKCSSSIITVALVAGTQLVACGTPTTRSASRTPRCLRRSIVHFMPCLCPKIGNGSSLPRGPARSTVFPSSQMGLRKFIRRYRITKLPAPCVFLMFASSAGLVCRRPSQRWRWLRTSRPHGSIFVLDGGEKHAPEDKIVL